MLTTTPESCEALLRIGLLIMTASAILSVLTGVILRSVGKRLNQQLDAEYGERRK